MSAGPAFCPKLYSHTMAMGATKNRASQNTGAVTTAAKGFFWLFQSCSAPDIF